MGSSLAQRPHSSLNVPSQGLWGSSLPSGVQPVTLETPHSREQENGHLKDPSLRT